MEQSDSIYEPNQITNSSLFDLIRIYIKNIYKNELNDTSILSFKYSLFKRGNKRNLSTRISCTFFSVVF